MRQFIRHPIDIPLVFKAIDQDGEQVVHTRNLSNCGLCFSAPECLPINSIVQISIPTIKPEAVLRARVIWCLRKNKHVDIGVEFFDHKESHRARMVEQVCHIKQYKKKIKRQEGRELSDKEAAAEWTDKMRRPFDDTDDLDPIWRSECLWAVSHHLIKTEKGPGLFLHESRIDAPDRLAREIIGRFRKTPPKRPKDAISFDGDTRSPLE